MIEFHKVQLCDKDWINEKLKDKKNLGCDYCFGNIFSYGAQTDVYVADCFGCLAVKTVYTDVDYYYFPVGNGDIASVLNMIIEEAHQSDRRAVLFGMNEEENELLKSLYHGAFESEPVRDEFDYVYLTEELINLSGKKFQPKRNHISFFKRNNIWNYERIEKNSIPECLEMSKKWLEQSNAEYRDDLESELKNIKCAFENYDELGYVGGLIRADGKVVAYTMGEKLNDDTFCIHIEKAFSDIRGASQLINQQFAENELKSYKYINREDDVGADNLRKAKLSYNPVFMVEKYETRIN